MPPHAGHIALCRAAEMMCDQLTILVCWLPDDPIAGELRMEWMRQLFPQSRLIGNGAEVPQHPDESEEFWPIWREIVQRAHPEPIDLLFAGEEYGDELAKQVGGKFVPLGGRIIDADQNGLGGLSGQKIREDLSAEWTHLPGPVRRDMVKTVVLHGIESSGKSTLAASLADELKSCWVPEYGRSHCVVHGTELSQSDLSLIAAAQQAMIASAKEWSGLILPCDTDWLMTRAWHRMIFDAPLNCPAFPIADLYLYLAADTEWIDDGLRLFGSNKQRLKFDNLCREELIAAGANWITINGSWDERYEQAIEAVQSLD
ncbi:AAA family ATPase [Parasphingopyxis sp. CP4]|uniref:AAA family ATPase n=1 Tax=Parasphingopyxis sp. CP4 TaxID=2724527 RepID=UPI00351A35F1